MTFIHSADLIKAGGDRIVFEMVLSNSRTVAVQFQNGADIGDTLMSIANACGVTFVAPTVTAEHPPVWSEIAASALRTDDQVRAAWSFVKGALILAKANTRDGFDTRVYDAAIVLCQANEHP